MNDEGVMWPISMEKITVFADDDLLSEEPEDLVVVTGLAWDPDDPYEVKVYEHELGYGPFESFSDGPFAVFDLKLIQQIIEAPQDSPFGEGRVRLECFRPDGSPVAMTRDEIWVALRVVPNGLTGFDSYYFPMRHLIDFVAAIHRIRPTYVEPEPTDWDAGLLELTRGTP